jgi:hypothetical protein
LNPQAAKLSIQVKQEDKAGRPNIDSFEAMMMREDCEKGFIVSFDYSDAALREIEGHQGDCKILARQARAP